MLYEEASLVKMEIRGGMGPILLYSNGRDPEDVGRQSPKQAGRQRDKELREQPKDRINNKIGEAVETPCCGKIPPVKQHTLVGSLSLAAPARAVCGFRSYRITVVALA
jgi:hypothetical protein